MDMAVRARNAARYLDPCGKLDQERRAILHKGPNQLRVQEIDRVNAELDHISKSNPDRF